MGKGDIADADAAEAAAVDFRLMQLRDRARQIGLDPNLDVGAVLSPLVIAEIHNLMIEIEAGVEVFNSSTKAAGMRRVADGMRRDLAHIRRMLSPPAIPRTAN